MRSRFVYVLVVTGAVLAGSELLFKLEPLPQPEWTRFALPLCWLLAFFLAGGYENWALRSPSRIAWLGILASAGAFACMLAFPGLRAMPGFALLALGLSSGATAIAMLSAALVEKVPLPERRMDQAVLVGENKRCLQLVQELRQHYRLRFFVNGKSKDLLETQHDPAPTLVYATNLFEPRELAALSEAVSRGCTVYPLSTYVEEITGKSLLVKLNGVWFSSVSWRHRPGHLVLFAKYTFDKLMALLMLVLSLPLVAAFALAILLEDGQPIFYAQERAGQNGRIFKMYKLRTMVKDAEKRTGAVWAASEDPRITKVGRILRETGIDEFAQFWNILKGDMSLVGPRPERPEIVEKLVEEIPSYKARLAVRPGLIGWAQLHRGGDTCLEDVIDKLRYDLYYIKHLSLWLDLRIFLESARMMLTRRKPATGQELGV